MAPLKKALAPRRIIPHSVLSLGPCVALPIIFNIQYEVTNFNFYTFLRVGGGVWGYILHDPGPDLPVAKILNYISFRITKNTRTEPQPLLALINNTVRISQTGVCLPSLICFSFLFFQKLKPEPTILNYWCPAWPPERLSAKAERPSPSCRGKNTPRSKCQKPTTFTRVRLVSESAVHLVVGRIRAR